MRKLAFAIAGALALAGTLHAAGEEGQVTFATAPVPGATVTATQGDKHIVTTTDAQGVYRFADLADLDVERPRESTCIGGETDQVWWT